MTPRPHSGGASLTSSGVRSRLPPGLPTVRRDMAARPGAGKARMRLVEQVVRPESTEQPSTPPRPTKQSQGLMVELVRLVTVVFFALGGWEISNSMSGNRAEAMVPGIVLGSCIGYVTGGILGRG